MSGDPEILDEKYRHLLNILGDCRSAVVAFSGGVDSSFLVKVMKIAGIRFLAVTGRSETVPQKDIDRAEMFAKEAGASHRIIETGELTVEKFLSNPPERCFYCKQDLFQRLRTLAEEESYDAVFDGSNADDQKDFRPGMRAAEMYGVRSPLAEAGLAKQEIRGLSKKLGLASWNRPASPCLSSRFPYGRRITVEGLHRVEKAEEYLRSLGMETVRVRIHDDVARIEVAEEQMVQLLEQRRTVADYLRELGFNFVCLDLEGFRSGSMNRALQHEKTVQQI